VLLRNQQPNIAANVIKHFSTHQVPLILPKIHFHLPKKELKIMKFPPNMMCVDVTKSFNLAIIPEYYKLSSLLLLIIPYKTF
jgi:hypothetical protein